MKLLDLKRLIKETVEEEKHKKKYEQLKSIGPEKNTNSALANWHRKLARLALNANMINQADFHSSSRFSS